MKRTLVLSLISIFGIRFSEAQCTYGYLAENGKYYNFDYLILFHFIISNF